MNFRFFKTHFFPAHLLLPMTLLGLAVSQPASAQKLNLVDGMTDVVNDGTRSGTFVTGATSVQFFEGASAATYNYNRIQYYATDVTSRLNLLTGSSADDAVNTGAGRLNVDGGSVKLLTNSSALTYVLAGDVTTLSNSGTAVVEGGTVHTLATGGGVEVSGGRVDILNGGGTVAVDGGSIGTFTNRFNGYVFIRGGSIDSLGGETFGVFHQQINMSGGSVTSLTNTQGSDANLSGGTINTLTNDQYATLEASQGIFNPLVVSTLDNYGAGSITGGQFSFLDNFTGGALDVFGHDLSLTDGYLTGQLQSGQKIDARYTDDGGVLTLHNSPVPEASSFVSFGLLMALGLGGMIARRRRSTKARA